MSIWNLKKNFNKNPKNKIPSQHIKKIVKYSAEDIEKVFNFLMADNLEGDLNFNVILSSLEHTAEKGIKSQGIRSIGNAYDEKKFDVKYSDEDFETVFNYLLTPNYYGIVPMDKLLNYLESLKTFVNKLAETIPSDDEENALLDGKENYDGEDK